MIRRMLLLASIFTAFGLPARAALASPVWETVSIRFEQSNPFNSDPSDVRSFMWRAQDSSGAFLMPDAHRVGESLAKLDTSKEYSCELRRAIAVPSPIGRFDNVFAVRRCTAQ